MTNTELPIAIGHVTLQPAATGCSVFILPQASPCGYWLCGSAPATRELSLLEADAMVPAIDAIVLTGGSAFGLGVADGVMQWLQQQGRGFPTLGGPVPIVPTAAIYDLTVGQAIAPTANDGYAACQQAKIGPHQHGQIGAATGASVGKLLPQARPMAGGIGWAEHTTANNGLQVLVYAVVNAVGDIFDATGKIVAGAQQDGKFIDLQHYFMTGRPTHTHLLMQTNTTLAVVFTNAAFDKAVLTRIAKTAAAGMAQAIRPCFTAYDGDVIFATSVGKQQADEVTVGLMAAELLRQAILKAVS